MNLYEAVYARKSVRSFAQDVVSVKVLDGIKKVLSGSRGFIHRYRDRSGYRR